MKILQKIKEWKLNRPESQWSKKKLAIAGAALVVAVGLVIGGKILVDHWQFKNYKSWKTRQRQRNMQNLVIIY